MKQGTNNNYVVFSTEDLLNEEWREIDEVPGIYISNLGRMMSKRRGKERILAVTPTSSTNPKEQYLGYPLAVNGRQRIFYPHRLVAKYFLSDEWFEGCEVHHLNGKWDNRKDSLICLTRDAHKRLHRAMRQKELTD